MKIFIDTNVFYNDWYMKNANFKYLFHFINNDNHRLIISRVVIEEVENIRQREYDAAVAEIKKQLNKIQKLNSDSLTHVLAEIKPVKYDFIALLKLRVWNVEIIEYSSVPHEEVVKKALKKTKPFLEGEKGYRDTLAWMSLLKYIKDKNVTDKINFITQNKEDYFQSKSGGVIFHPDLTNDIREKNINIEIKPFTSLFNFVDCTIDKDDHAIDRDSSLDIFEPYLESEGTSYIQSIPNNYLLELLEEVDLNSGGLENIQDVVAENFEGLEDPEINSTKQLDNNDVYVNFRHTLQTVLLKLQIPKADYYLHAKSIDKKFINISVESEIVNIECAVNALFDVSFIFNTKDKTLKAYEVAYLSFYA